jgi:CheY-like chemotaxis protein
MPIPLDPLELDRPVRIAIVDDVEVGRRVIGTILTKVIVGQVEVVTGTNGYDAIALRDADPVPDLMFINWQMPGLDGRTAIERIRSMETGTGRLRIPIVFYSSGLSHDGAERAIAAGADDCISLPFDVSELVVLLARHLAPPT